MDKRMTLRLHKSLDDKISLLATKKYMSKSDIVRQAIVRYIEDNEHLLKD